jgi:vancomycin resistance protein YoaR
MRNQTTPFTSIGFAFAGAAAIFVAALLALVIGFQAFYNGYIYPGVQVGWIDIAGMKPEDAAALLDYQITYPQRGRVLLRDGDQIWVATPSEVGLTFNANYNAQMAYEIGRDGSFSQQVMDQFRAWYSGVTLTPALVFDEHLAENYLRGLAAQIDRPTVEASLEINGTDVVVKPGQIGRKLDIYATRDLLRDQVQMLIDGEVPLVIEEDKPTILDVSEQADLARQILSAPLVISVPDTVEGDSGPWRFKPEDLAEMLTIEWVETSDGATYQVGLDTGQLRAFLNEIAPNLEKQAANARFIFNDDTRELEVIQPAVIGQSLDVEASITVINESLIAGQHQVKLDLDYDLPEITDDVTAADLGITELIHSEVSYFRGSDSSRVQNIETASSRFHGLLVAPGETFSMASIIGDVSLDTGYAEAWIIYGDRTIKGVGGGVCQVSTTLFRTVFFSGFPVVERYPHAYRVYYYEQTYSGHDASLAGLDATVYVPLVDFKFTNDTPYWLLMETYMGDNWLQWKFYSTSDGRSVDWSTSGLRNQQDPPDPVYNENPNLAEGEIKQVDWAVEGADVSITRTVSRDGSTLFEDVFNTHYEPWRAVCEYGPGTTGMPPARINSSSPCTPSTRRNN